MKQNEFGTWEITVPAVNGQPAIPHNSKLKVCIDSFTGPIQTVNYQY